MGLWRGLWRRWERRSDMSAATLSTVEAATMLGRTRHCIRLWCESGKLLAKKDDFGCYRIPEAEVLKLTVRTRSLAVRKTHTLAEAAAMLGIPKNEVQQLCDRRHLCYLKLPTGRVLIEASEIERFIARYRKTS